MKKIVTTCDICGKEINHSYDVHAYQHDALHCIDYEIQRIDICSNCLQHFQAYLVRQKVIEVGLENIKERKNK